MNRVRFIKLPFCILEGYLCITNCKQDLIHQGLDWLSYYSGREPLILLFVLDEKDSLKSWSSIALFFFAIFYLHGKIYNKIFIQLLFNIVKRISQLCWSERVVWVKILFIVSKIVVKVLTFHLVHFVETTFNIFIYFFIPPNKILGRHNCNKLSWSLLTKPYLLLSFSKVFG